MPKARDVEALLVWAFRDQKIEAVAAGVLPRAQTWSQTSSLGEIMALGTRVDSSSAGARHVAIHCHEDAAVIYDAVMALPPDAWQIVIKHARTGTQPDWHPEGPGVWVVPLDRNGRPKRLWRDPAKQKGDLGPAPAELVGTRPEVVEQDRRAYAMWHAALVDLVGLLNAEMVDHEAIGPEAPPAPWNDQPRAVDGGKNLTHSP